MSASLRRSMQYAEHGTSNFIVRLEMGEDILVSLRRLAEAKRIHGAYFEGIGSLNKVKLGHYDFKTKQYKFEVFEDDLEILSLTGNISTMDRHPLPHVHVTLGRRDFTTLGGHLDEGSLANMVEILLQRIPGRVVKAKDENVGLNLLQLPRKL